MTQGHGDDNGLLATVIEALRQQPGSTAHDLVEAAHAQGVIATKTDINRLLYLGADEAFAKDGSTRPRWFLRDPGAEVTEPLEWSLPSSSSLPSLHQWQAEALEAWSARRRRGVIEAVTGTGKTLVGIAAAEAELDAGGSVLVLVPTQELQRQWHNTCTRYLPGTVGRLGGGHNDSIDDVQVLIAIVNSARTRAIAPARGNGLLIADECHRYASPTNQRALGVGFPHRLGLTATYRRDDDAHLSVLDPYFGGICYSIGYRQAVAQGVTARFKVALVGLPLSRTERDEYEALSSEISKLQYQLQLVYDLPAEPFAEFMRAVGELAEAPNGTPGRREARTFQRTINARIKLLAESEAKLDALKAIAPAVLDSDRALVFTSTIDGADACASKLRLSGAFAVSMHSDQDNETRAALLASFERGRIKAIVAPRVLDEGVDVPAADLAVIVSASRTRRQMIQRMGRVLRRKPDGRLARFAILFAEGTIEDPDWGAHESFLEEVTSAADRVERFKIRDRRAILAYLAVDGVGAARGASTAPRPAPKPRRAKQGDPRRPLPAERRSLSPRQDRERRWLKAWDDAHKFTTAQERHDAVKVLRTMADKGDEILLPAIARAASTSDLNTKVQLIEQQLERGARKAPDTTPRPAQASTRQSAPKETFEKPLYKPAGPRSRCNACGRPEEACIC